MSISAISMCRTPFRALSVIRAAAVDRLAVFDFLGETVVKLQAVKLSSSEENNAA